MNSLQLAKRYVSLRGAHFLEKSKWLSSFLRLFSCYIVRNEPEQGNYRYLFRLAHFLKERQISAVFDVGASNGTYGSELRKFGYMGKIFSFEPVEGPFQILCEAAKGDPLWSCRRLALGDRHEKKKIRVLKELPASSFLKTSARHREANPQACETHTEQVEVHRLDTLYPELCTPSDRVFLKIDTQGYEKRVLEGAGEFLSKIELVQIEVSLEALYEGEEVFPELFSYMKERLFVPIALDPISRDPRTGEFLQIDLLFRNQGGI